jgi:hypothetical protein
MSTLDAQEVYPRKLRSKELDVIEFVFPVDRPGYRQYRQWISSMVVLGEGRRGKGNLIIGYEGDVPDRISPLAAVIAYGVVETTQDPYSITVREYLGRQIDLEIVSTHGADIPDHFEEKRRWTYSSWLPGQPSPATEEIVREIGIEENLVLVIARLEKRLWVYNSTNGMNVLVPITNFYNELMLQKNIRDPRIALKSDRFFQDLDTYTDSELRSSFIAYNKLKPKVEIKTPIVKIEERGFKTFVAKLLKRHV